jgi:hypothetical protein
VGGASLLEARMIYTYVSSHYTKEPSVSENHSQSPDVMPCVVGIDKQEGTYYTSSSSVGMVKPTPEATFTGPSKHAYRCAI